MFLTRTLLCCLILCSALTVQGQDWSAGRFDKDVASLLVSRCLDCHSGPKPKGKLDLSKKASTFKGGESGPAVVANDLAQSLIWQRVSAGEMPPKKKLTESELSLLKSWIESGAVWGSDPIDPFRITTDKRAGYDWWSLQPLRDVSPPKIKNSASVKNPIDAFVVRRLEDTGLTPSPQASAAVLLRRLEQM